nr:peptidylprolyl isomerase [uncultured Butyricicoccus sp.]
MNKAKIIKRIAAGALAALTALTLTACGDSQQTASVSEEQKQAVVLTVNDKDFTATQYAAAFLYNQNRLDSMLSGYGQQTSKDITDADDRKVYSDNIAQLAEKQLAYLTVCEEQMQAAGLTVEDSDIEQQLKEQAEMMGGDAALDSYLKEMGLTREQYSDFVRLSVMVSKLRENYFAQNPDAARKAFDEQYLRCKHVLIKTVDDNNAPLDNQDELKAKAEDVAKRAKAGEDFDTLIANYNDDPGMESNPDGYVFTEGEMVDEFYQGTKALAIDGISEPIQSTYGWHIIKRLPLRDEDFESKKSTIEESLFSDLVDTWQESATIEGKDGINEINLDTAAAYVQ